VRRGERRAARDEESPGVVDGSQLHLVMHEYRRISARWQSNGPALHLIGDHERVRRLALREAAVAAGPHEHRAVRLANDVYRFLFLAVLAALDVSKTYKV